MAGESSSGKKITRLALLAFVTGFSGAIMPGPLLVAVIGQTFAQGYRGMIGLITGHALLELVIVGMLVMGLQQVIARPRARGAIGLIGGIVLVWMGWDMMMSAGQLTLEFAASDQAAYSWPLLLFWGAAVCAANPYFTGWWATIGAGQLAQMAPKTIGEYMAFYLGHEASDYAWYFIVAFIIVSGRSWLSDELYQSMIYVCGAIVVLLGIWFLGSGLRFIIKKPALTTPEPPALEDPAK